MRELKDSLRMIADNIESTDKIAIQKILRQAADEIEFLKRVVGEYRSSEKNSGYFDSTH